jgi:hypothetical protein
MDRGFRFTKDGIEQAAILNRMADDWQKRTGLDLSALARAVGRNAAWLFKVLEAKLHMHSDVVPELTRRTGDTRLIEELARQCGGVYVPLPKAGKATDNLCELVRECGEAFASVGNALADGRVTADEYACCRREIREAIAKALEVDKQLEQMSYAPHARPATMAQAEPANVHRIGARQ